MTMHSQRIYLDTSILSAINDLREPEKAKDTKDFLKKLPIDDVYISTLVQTELNQIADLNRLKEINTISKQMHLLEITDEILKCSDYYLKHGLIPKAEVADATHLACATINNISILVSWNYKHIVKYKTKHLITGLNILQGYNNIEIVSPWEF